MSLPIHPAALLFPALSEPELKALANDIRAHGLRSPIVLFEDQVIDGRHRLRACELAGVQPRFEHYEGDDPVGYAASLNLHRRHLSTSQRAMIAAKLADMKQGARTDLPSIGGRSQAQAATLLNVSPRTVQRATKVLKSAPHLAAEVTNGKMAVSEASQLAKLGAPASPAPKRQTKPVPHEPAPYVRVRLEDWRALQKAVFALEMPDTAGHDDAAALGLLRGRLLAAANALRPALSRCEASFMPACAHCGGPCPEGRTTCGETCRTARGAATRAQRKTAVQGRRAGR